MTLPVVTPLSPTDALVARLTPGQQHLILQLNMARWQHAPIVTTVHDEGLMRSLCCLGIVDAETGALTHQGVLVAGALSLQRLRQDP